jgi:3-oxoisoapionate decarboxylase
MLRGLAGMAAAGMSSRWGRGELATGRKRMGVGMHSYGGQWLAARQGHSQARFRDALTFLNYGDELGAGGVQVAIGIQEAAYAKRLRSRTEETGMYLESQALLPKEAADADRFENEVRTAREAGAEIMRTAFLSGRRYEQFQTAEAFRNFAAQSWKSLTLAEGIVKRHRMRLAVENHKDWRIEELLKMMEGISSEWVGVLVDTGNSIALLEDPMEVVEAYAPWAVSTHIKDMGVAEYENGFLLSEVPLGTGFLDLAGMMGILEQANPRIRWNLEMITRDPLRIPCLTEGYWATFGEVTGMELARMLRLVRTWTGVEPLPEIRGLSFEERLAKEDENARASLEYAGKHLGER